MTRDPRAFASEKAFQDAVVRMARTQGVLAYHTYDARRSQPGYPDLTLVGRGDIIWRELKTDKGVLSPEQVVFIEAIQDAGGNADVWRPRDWYSGRIEQELRVLGRVRVQLPPPSQAQLRAHLQKGRPAPEIVNPGGNAR